MKKKMMLIPILALLLLSVPVVIAGSILIIGDGEYSQTMEFGDVSDSVTLTGEWVFESNWGYGSGPDINNYVILDDGATFSEHAVSPRGALCGEGYSYAEDEDANPGLDLTTFVQYGDGSIYDTAEIQVRGYDFTFTADTTSSYTSTKDLVVLDSYYNIAEDGEAAEYMDWARFQVTDTNDITGSAYVVGGIIEYEEAVPNFFLAFPGCLYLTQTFTQGSDTSDITSRHTIYNGDWVRVTAFFGYDTAGDLDEPLDWYGEVTEDAHTTDIFYANVVDDTAHFSLLYGEALNSITLDAYSTVGDFDAYGSAEDVAFWEFTGLNLHREDGKSIDWTANLDMDT